MTTKKQIKAEQSTEVEQSTGVEQSTEVEQSTGVEQAAESIETVVYCGPTIPGIAKQFAVYNNGLTGMLAGAAENNPAISSLIVPLAQLPDTMRQLRERTGSIYTLYRRAVQGK